MWCVTRVTFLITETLYVHVRLCFKSRPVSENENNIQLTKLLLVTPGKPCYFLIENKKLYKAFFYIKYRFEIKQKTISKNIY